MLITIDVGNTHTVFGLWISRQLKDVCRFSTSLKRTSHEWSSLIRGWLESIKKRFRLHNNKDSSSSFSMIYSSVVPSIGAPLEEAFSILEFKDIQCFNLDMQLPISFNYPSPQSLGMDRIVNSIAGILLYGKNLIIVDFGTAITFCLIIDSVYLGGVIVPGLQAGLDFLASKTAKLPQLSWNRNNNVLGKSTEESILSGTHLGWSGMVSNILLNLKSEVLRKKIINNINELQVVATGGYSHNFFLDEQFFDIIDRNLTLRGLHKIFCMN